MVEEGEEDLTTGDGEEILTAEEGEEVLIVDKEGLRVEEVADFVVEEAENMEGREEGGEVGSMVGEEEVLKGAEGGGEKEGVLVMGEEMEGVVMEMEMEMEMEGVGMKVEGEEGEGVIEVETEEEEGEGFQVEGGWRRFCECVDNMCRS